MLTPDQFPASFVQLNKKGHRYIVPLSGPARPVSNTQAMPHLGAPTFLRLLTTKLAGLRGNAKKSVLHAI
jgi:hypothetical protein